MEETKEIEPTIEIIKPVVITIEINGKARRDDNKYNVVWFDRTIKTIDYPTFTYNIYDFNRALQEVTAIYQLNADKIISIKLKTI